MLRFHSEDRLIFLWHIFSESKITVVDVIERHKEKYSFFLPEERDVMMSELLVPWVFGDADEYGKNGPRE